MAAKVDCGSRYRKLGPTGTNNVIGHRICATLNANLTLGTLSTRFAPLRGGAPMVFPAREGVHAGA